MGDKYECAFTSELSEDAGPARSLLAVTCLGFVLLALFFFSFFLFLITFPHTVLLLTSKYDGMARALGG